MDGSTFLHLSNFITFPLFDEKISNSKEYFLNSNIKVISTIFQIHRSFLWKLTFLVLDFSLYIIDSITWFNLKGDGLASQSFDKNLHGELKENWQYFSNNIILEWYITFLFTKIFLNIYENCSVKRLIHRLQMMSCLYQLKTTTNFQRQKGHNNS